MPNQHPPAHSPAPWYADGPGFAIYYDAGLGRIATVEGRSPAQRLANARLIAASPALYEALSALGAIGDGYCFCSSGRDPEQKRHEPECRDARAALLQVENPT